MLRAYIIGREIRECPKTKKPTEIEMGEIQGRNDVTEGEKEISMSIYLWRSVGNRHLLRMAQSFFGSFLLAPFLPLPPVLSSGVSGNLYKTEFSGELKQNRIFFLYIFHYPIAALSSSIYPSIRQCFFRRRCRPSILTATSVRLHYTCFFRFFSRLFTCNFPASYLQSPLFCLLLANVASFSIFVFLAFFPCSGKKNRSFNLLSDLVESLKNDVNVLSLF